MIHNTIQTNKTKEEFQRTTMTMTTMTRTTTTLLNKKKKDDDDNNDDEVRILHKTPLLGVTTASLLEQDDNINQYDKDDEIKEVEEDIGHDYYSQIMNCMTINIMSRMNHLFMTAKKTVGPQPSQTPNIMINTKNKKKKKKRQTHKGDCTLLLDQIFDS
jgi:hypothetical protein